MPKFFIDKNDIKNEKITKRIAFYLIVLYNIGVLLQYLCKGVAIMEIVNRASAGTMESSDAYVEIEPCTGAVEIQLESVVAEQFGDSIRAAVTDVLSEHNVTAARIHVVDRGALDCVIRARVETAIRRGKGEA